MSNEDKIDVERKDFETKTSSGKTFKGKLPPGVNSVEELIAIQKKKQEQ